MSSVVRRIRSVGRRCFGGANTTLFLNTVCSACCSGLAYPHALQRLLPSGVASSYFVVHAQAPCYRAGVVDVAAGRGRTSVGTSECRHDSVCRHGWIDDACCAIDRLPVPGTRLGFDPHCCGGRRGWEDTAGWREGAGGDSFLVCGQRTPAGRGRTHAPRRQSFIAVAGHANTARFSPAVVSCGSPPSFFFFFFLLHSLLHHTCLLRRFSSASSNDGRRTGRRTRRSGRPRWLSSTRASPRTMRLTCALGSPRQPGLARAEACLVAHAASRFPYPSCVLDGHEKPFVNAHASTYYTHPLSIARLVFSHAQAPQRRRAARRAP